jgi:hypothetical protein
VETKDASDAQKGKTMATTAKFGGAEQQEDDASQPIFDRRKKP